MNKFLEICSLPRLNYEFKKGKTLHRPITNKKLESVIKNLSKKEKKIPRPDSINGELYQTFEEN